MSRAVAVLVTAAALSCVTAQAAAAEISFGHSGGIWTMADDGSGARPLPLPGRVGGRRVHYGYARWSPDGGRLAVTRFVNRPGEDRDSARIVLVASDGTRARTLTAGGTAVQYGAAWSPDGSRIAFVRGTRSQDAIVVVDVATRRERVVARETRPQLFRWLGAATWSPDGARLAYTAYRYGLGGILRPAIRVVGSTGAGDRRLADHASEPAWSPDGRLIAYTSVRDRNGSHALGSDESAHDGELYVMKADGTLPRRLTHSVGHEAGPRWSPDGTRIAFSSDRNFPGTFENDNAEIYSVAPDGTCLTWLTNRSTPSTDPDWRPGGGPSTPTCGGSAPGAVVDTDARRAARVRGYRPYWLGPRFGEILLSGFFGGGRWTSFGYDDCATADGSGCEGVLQVNSESTCREPDLESMLEQARSFLVERGALVVVYLGGPVNVFAGQTNVGLRLQRVPEFDESVSLMPAVRLLRDYGATAPAALQAPILPARLLRNLDRVTRAYARHRTVAGVARELRLHPSRVRVRLRIARGLRPFGRIARCP